MTGLHAQPGDSGIPHAPLTEIAWCISAAHWGKGYATEAARSFWRFVFGALVLDALYSFTAQVNPPSQQEGLRNLRYPAVPMPLICYGMTLVPHEH